MSHLTLPQFFFGIGPLVDHPTRTETPRLEDVGKKKLTTNVYLGLGYARKCPSSFFIFEPRSLASQAAIHAVRFSCRLRRSKVAEGSRKCDRLSNICGTVVVQVYTGLRGHFLGNMAQCMHIVRCPICRTSCFSNACFG